MSSLVEKVQDFLERDLGRPLNSAELRVVRRFGTDFQAAGREPEPVKTKAQGEIVSEPWRPPATAGHAEGEVKHIVKAESKLFSRVDAWAQMASQGGSSPSPSSRSRSSSRPPDLDVDVGMKDRLGKWKSAEEAKEGEVGRASPRTTAAKPSDLTVDVGMKDRLGKWKSAEEAKAEVTSPRKEQVKIHEDSPVEDVKARLNKYQTVTSSQPTEKKNEPVKTVAVREKDDEVKVVEVAPLRERLNSYQRNVEEKEKNVSKSVTSDSSHTPVSARKDLWNEVTSEKKLNAADASKEETVQAAPKLKDRLNMYNQVTADKPVEKAQIVVPYDDDYTPPVPPSEEAANAPIKRDLVRVETGASLKDRVNTFTQATVDKPLEKKPIEIPGDEVAH